MAIEYGVAQARITHPVIQTLVISTFRQPDPQRPFSNQALVLTDRSSKLPPHRFRVLAQQGQVAMGGSAGQQINGSAALQGGEPSDQIGVTALPGLQMALHRGGQMVAGMTELGLRFRQ